MARLPPGLRSRGTALTEGRVRLPPGVRAGHSTLHVHVPRFPAACGAWALRRMGKPLAGRRHHGAGGAKRSPSSRGARSYGLVTARRGGGDKSQPLTGWCLSRLGGVLTRQPTLPTPRERKRNLPLTPWPTCVGTCGSFGSTCKPQTAAFPF